MKTKILLVFPGLRINETAGEKHRLNCFIDAYYKKGYDVSVLAFFKGNPFSSRRELNEKAKWMLFPVILPMIKAPVLTIVALWYFKLIFAVATWFSCASVIQMEKYSFRSCLCNRRKRYITDVHGDSLHEFAEMRNGDKEHWYSKILVQKQKEIIKYSDRIICVSENLKKQLEINTGMKILDYRIISCGVDLSRYSVPKASLPVNIDGRIVVGYSGALQAWQCVEDIIKVSTLLHQKDKRIFLIIYTMDSVNPYRTLLDKLGEENYYITSLRTEEVPSHLKLFDAGFLVRDNFILNKVASPTKTPEYLAAGAGLICTAYSGDYEVYTKGRGNGFVLDDNRFEKIDQLLEWLYKIKKEKPDNSFLSQFTFQEQFDRSKVFEF